MTVGTWAMGKRYTGLGSNGVSTTGYIDPPPQKPAALLDGNGRIFVRTKPSYSEVSAGSFVIATEHGVNNMASGDQSDAINSLLANNIGKPIFFPAGIYIVQKTVVVPLGSIIVGELWSQVRDSIP